MRSVPSGDLAQVEPGKKDNVLPYLRQKQIVTIASFSEISNEWGSAGSRSQGPRRVPSITSAASFQERVAFSSKLPFPMGSGLEILPLGVREAIRCIPEGEV